MIALSGQETLEQESAWMVQSWQMMLVKLKKHWGFFYPCKS